MYSFLPDELLAEILTPALQVPDDSFACISGKSPFINYERSTSAYLLVCKDWLRVSTPLLYSVVVLRSKAQIQALEFALKSTPELGGLVKKLRVESGYSVSLLKILQSTKNLTDLCLSLEVYSSDNVSGICRGLPFINPRHVIVYDPTAMSRSWNQKAQQMVDCLKEHLGKWDKLTTFVFPNYFRWIEIRTKQEDYVEGLEKSKSIETVSIISPHSINIPWFDRLSKIPTLKKIIIRGAQNSYMTTFDAEVKASPRLKKLCYYANFDLEPKPPLKKEASSSPSLKAAFPPRNWITTFSNEIWLRILTHALEIPDMEDTKFRGSVPVYGSGIVDLKYRQGLALICKTLHKLVLPLYYHSVILVDHAAVARVKKLLERNIDLGKMIKSLFTVDFNYTANVTQNINDILEHTPNLQRVAVDRIYGRRYHSGSSTDILDWTSLTKLSQKAGHCLLDLSIHLHRPTTVKSPDVFYAFKKLRNLEFSSSAKFTVEPEKIKKKAMPCLESIKFSSINNTLLSVMSNMDLPKIRKAQFPVLEKSEGAITFLRKHGHKLRSLEIGFLPGVSVFDVCPNLLEFIVPLEKPGFAVAEFFSSTNEHPLQTIHIKTKDVAQGAVKDKFKYIGDLDLSNFTSLEKIMIDNCVWPVTENEIKKSHWATWAERLSKEYQVNIVNDIGQHWIPRLRAK